MTPNIYYSPKTYGLSTVGEIEWSDGNYQFDLTVVWQGEDGRFWMADDKGCSCPSPYEDTNVSDLVEITSLASFQEFCAAHRRDNDVCDTEIVNIVERLHQRGLR